MNDAKRKINVALVAPSIRNVGGQSIQARRLIDAFATNENPHVEFVANDPPTVFQNVKFLRTVFASLAFWFALFKKIPPADIVHIFSSGTTSYIISTLPPFLIAKFFGAKTILHYHTGEAEKHLTEWKRTAKPTMKLFDEIVAPSEFLVDVFRKFDLPARAIYNFVETDRFVFRNRKPLRPIFLSNRNFEAHYQVADVLRACRIIQNEFPAASLIVAGYGSEEQQLKSLAAELDLKNIEFVGRVENAAMPRLYDRADIYLNSSVVDNMPLSIIEAFACGLPVVSTNAGGIPYICEHEETALLVEVNDYKALARETIRLLESDDLAQKIIANARRNCVKYSWENARAEWLETYRRLAAERI